MHRQSLNTVMPSVGLPNPLDFALWLLVQCQDHNCFSMYICPVTEIHHLM